jgi:hypothetical protein
VNLDTKGTRQIESHSGTDEPQSNTLFDHDRNEDILKERKTTRFGKN